MPGLSTGHAGVALSVWEATEYFAGASEPTPLGSAHRMVAPYQAFLCADGAVTIGASTDLLFQRLCNALGHPEWPSIAEFADNASRVRHRAVLAERIESVTRQRPRSHWLAVFEASDIPSGPINSYAEVFADPQIVARDMVLTVDHPTLGTMQTLGSPIKLSATPPEVRRRAPHLGEHTEEVLREAGFDDAHIAVHARGKGRQVLRDEIRLLVLHDQCSALRREIEQATIVGDKCKACLGGSNADNDGVELSQIAGCQIVVIQKCDLQT